MERLKEIEAELSGIAPVLGKDGITVQPYRVPTGYFEHFADHLLQRIRIDEENGLSKTESNQAGDLSKAGYPAALPEENPDSEMTSLSPLLAGLERKTPYQVPGYYFSEFKANTDIPAASKAKLIPMHSGKRLMRYAVAAMVAAVMATTAFFTFHKYGTDPLNGLANVSGQEMASYLENHDVHWAPGTSKATTTVDFNDNDISDLLSTVSDTELELYLPDLPVQKRTTN